MPLDEKILGFSNSWYASAMGAAKERELDWQAAAVTLGVALQPVFLASTCYYFASI